MDALPVVVRLDGWLAEQVAAHVEQQLGWQVVGGAGLQPRLALADSVVPGTPTVIIRPGQPGPLPAGALAVVGWPAQRLLLAELSVPDPDSGGDARVLVVGSRREARARSVVALAVAGAQAWSGLRVALVGSPTAAALAGLALPALTTTALAATPAAARAQALVDEAAAVPGARGLWLLSGRLHAPPSGWGVDVVVVDGGEPDRADVLVSTAPGGHPRVVVPGGPQLCRLQRGLQRLLVLPHSARVARATVKRRLPGALPGRMVAALAWLVDP